jgi:hypothetical protein
MNIKKLICVVGTMAWSLFVMFSGQTLAMPSLVSGVIPNADYFIMQVGDMTYKIPAVDEIMKAEFGDIPDGTYYCYTSSCDEAEDENNIDECTEVIYFWLTIETVKNNRYYAVSPAEGYEEYFIEPTSIFLNTKAGKPTGKPHKKNER